MFCHSSIAILFLSVLFGPILGSPVTRDDTKINIKDAYNTLQKWYNDTTGIWNPSTGWWNSANCLTLLCNLAAVESSLNPKIRKVITITYEKAPQYNSQMLKIAGVNNDEFLVQTYYSNSEPLIPESFLKGQSRAQANNGFLNGYYDDEGWWALAWIQAYDLTGNAAYLNTAIDIFNDMKEVFGKSDTNCSTNSGGTGGIWWDKQRTYVNAIANELFLTTAASLANRVPPKSKQTYLSIAEQQWSWFNRSGMIVNNLNLINDGLNSTCKNNGGTVFTYNQGVILGGLVELYNATNNTALLDKAHAIATAATDKLATKGILVEPCEVVQNNDGTTSQGDCGADGSQFKGVFVRNLGILHKASPRADYKSFLKNNANSIWKNDRDAHGQLGLYWTGRFNSTPNASTHSSAMDCLVASMSVGN